MPDVIMHVNYFERGYSLATLFDKAGYYGYDGIELRGFREGTTTTDYLQEIKQEMSRTGMAKVIMACPCNLNNAEAAARAAEIEKCSEMLRGAAGLGVTLCNASAGPVISKDHPYSEYHRNGSGAATWEQWAWAVEGYQQLGALAAELGLKLAFETHNGFIHDLARPTAELLRRINCPAVGANLDMGNIVLNSRGESAVDACLALGDRIYHTHLKNVFKPSGGGYIVCGLADGIIDNRVWLSKLQEMGYAGPLCIEAPRLGDRDFFARSDIAYLRSVLADLGWE